MPLFIISYLTWCPSVRIHDDNLKYPSLRGALESSASVAVTADWGRSTDTASSTSGCRPLWHSLLFTRRRFTLRKIIMEGNICNIQVLLRAAEFLDRRERGECVFCDNCQCAERKLIIVISTKCTMKTTQTLTMRAKMHDEVAIRGSFSRFNGVFFARKLFLDDVSHLTQWPTYRSHHCTQRRQSDPIWKWVRAAQIARYGEWRPDRNKTAL